jgi:hypothetical protein
MLNFYFLSHDNLRQQCDIYDTLMFWDTRYFSNNVVNSSNSSSVGDAVPIFSKLENLTPKGPNDDNFPLMS